MVNHVDRRSNTTSYTLDDQVAWSADLADRNLTDHVVYEKPNPIDQRSGRPHRDDRTIRITQLSQYNAQKSTATTTYNAQLALETTDTCLRRHSTMRYGNVIGGSSAATEARPRAGRSIWTAVSRAYPSDGNDTHFTQ